jgi:hypothetical protein
MKRKSVAVIATGLGLARSAPKALVIYSLQTRLAPACQDSPRIPPGGVPVASGSTRAHVPV